MTDDFEELDRIMSELEEVELPDDPEEDIPDPDLSGIDLPDLDELPEAEWLDDDLNKLLSDFD